MPISCSFILPFYFLFSLSFVGYDNNFIFKLEGLEPCHIMEQIIKKYKQDETKKEDINPEFASSSVHNRRICVSINATTKILLVQILNVISLKNIWLLRAENIYLSKCT